ncbi:MAG: IclR family transcriptional regulator [Bacillota bacterium]
METEYRQKKVQAVERTLLILAALAKENEPMTLSDISRKTRLNISTTHRLLNTLVQNSFAEQDITTGKYKLGLKFFEIGNSALYSLDIRNISRPYLYDLVQRYRETANLYIQNHGEITLIDQVESPGKFKMALQIGASFPINCLSAGKIFLAELGDYEVNRIFRIHPLHKYTARTITDFPALQRELADVRKRQYAESKDEMEEGIGCLAAPIRTRQGKVVAALSILGPTHRIHDPISKPKMVRGLKEAGEQISLKLGYSSHFFRDQLKFSAQ